MTPEREAEIRDSVKRLIQLSPKAAGTVQELLAEVDRLRAENSEIKKIAADYFHLAKGYCDVSDALRHELKMMHPEYQRMRARVANLRDAVKHTEDFCLCSRNIIGFDYGEIHPLKGKPKAGARWLTPRDVAIAALAEDEGAGNVSN